MKKKIPVGSKVTYCGAEHTLLGYSKLKDSCVIEGPKGKHHGNVVEYWHDERGNRIPYTKGDNRYFVSAVYIKPVIKKEPEFIFNI